MICNKSMYLTEKDAKYAMKHYRKAASKRGVKPPVRHYACNKCNNYHLTSISYREAKK